MKLIGLTGSIATGKSTVARMFRDLGCYLIDADELAHAVYEKGSEGYFKVVGFFGDGILDKEGNIDRKKLGGVVLSDKEKLKKLEEIVHPLVEKRRNEILKEIESKDRDALVIYDVPLLFEKGMQDMFDCIIVVWVPEDLQIERLKKRDGITQKEAQKKISLQMSIDKKRKLADVVIDNSKDLNHTRAQVEKVFEGIKEGEICSSK